MAHSRTGVKKMFTFIAGIVIGLVIALLAVGFWIMDSFGDI